MEVPARPFYLVPEQDAPLFDRDGSREIAVVVVGSDLLVNLVLEATPGDNVQRPEVVARAMDGDGNQLGVLGRFCDAPAAQQNLPVVVASAVRLFPNHLLTPLDNNRASWATRFCQVRWLREKDVARIDGRWRYVYGVYDPSDDQPPDGFPRAAELLAHMPAEQRLIHYIDDATSGRDDTHHGFAARAEYDLVEIQVPRP